MDPFFIAIIFFSSLNVHGQGDADDQTSRFNLQIDLGVSYLFQWDQSYITSSSLTDLDSRMVGNLGLGGRWNILKEAKGDNCKNLGKPTKGNSSR